MDSKPTYLTTDTTQVSTYSLQQLNWCAQALKSLKQFKKEKSFLQLKLEISV